MTTTTTTDLTTEAAAIRAVSQLLSLVVGSNSAKATDYLKDAPVKRVSACLDLSLAEYQKAMAVGNSTGIRQVQRKLDALGSLAILATLVDEVEWDE
jgi:hypothetical protein